MKLYAVVWRNKEDKAIRGTVFDWYPDALDFCEIIKDRSMEPFVIEIPLRGLVI